MYLDPGFGSMLIQIIIALIAASGALLFSFRKKITAFFTKRKNKNASTHSAASVISDDMDDVVDTLESIDDSSREN